MLNDSVFADALLLKFDVAGGLAWQKRWTTDHTDTIGEGWEALWLDGSQLQLVGAAAYPSGGKAGFGVLMGPTGGYLIGFVIGAVLIGKLVRLRESPGFFWLLFSMAVGHLIVYGCGVLQLCQVAKLDLAKALTVGVLPFIPGDLLKMCAASYITLKLRDKIKA
jgi:biotin transporter BioY